MGDIDYSVSAGLFEDETADSADFRGFTISNIKLSFATNWSDISRPAYSRFNPCNLRFHLNNLLEKLASKSSTV